MARTRKAAPSVADGMGVSMSQDENVTPCVRVKDGVEFKVIAPSGFVILAAIQLAAESLAHDLTITSGTDGEHSGPNDPHHRGEAYDVRTKDLPDKQAALLAIEKNLFDEEHFFAFIEDPGTDNEHIHCQVRKGTEYPPPEEIGNAAN